MRLHVAILVLLTACNSEWVRDVSNRFEGSQYLEEREMQTHWVTRVVDADTGEPIEGAKFFAIEEHDYAMARLAKPGRVALSNEDGWVRYEVEPWEGTWYYVTKQGYGPHAEMGVPDPIELHKGVDVPIVLKDALGRPVPHARIGYYLGCGHTPDSRQVDTDASGRAVVPCIDPDKGNLFPLTSGVESGDYDVSPEITAPPSIDVFGEVIEADGRPVSGAYVGNPTWNHGPWTRTDERGRFRLVGMEPFDMVRVFRDMGQTENPAAVFRAPPRGVRRVVMLGPREKNKRKLRVETGADVWVWAVRDGDGWTAADTTDDDGTALLQVPDGKYTVTIGRGIGRYASVRRRVENYETVRVKLLRHPPLRFDASRVPEWFEIVLSSRYEQRKLTDDEIEAGVIHVRPGPGLVLRAQLGDHCGAIVPVPRKRDAVLLLPKPEPSSWMLADEAEAKAPPEEPRVHRVRVLTAGGWPVDGAYVASEDPDGSTMAHTDDDGWAEIKVVGPDLIVQADDCLPVRVPIVAEVRLGPCILEVTLIGADGARVVMDGEHFGMDRTLEVRGLQPGPHRVLVAAKGFLAKDCRVVLEAGETRTLALRLRRP